MNDIIKAELNKVVNADLSNYNSDKHTYYIKKLNNIQLIEDHCYLIKLKDKFFNNLKTSIITTNWNNGSTPKYLYYKIDICKIMTKMIKVNGVAFDNDKQVDINEVWSGWLSLDDVEILSEI